MRCLVEGKGYVCTLYELLGRSAWDLLSVLWDTHEAFA